MALFQAALLATVLICLSVSDAFPSKGMRPWGNNKMFKKRWDFSSSSSRPSSRDSSRDCSDYRSEDHKCHWYLMLKIDDSDFSTDSKDLSSSNYRSKSCCSSESDYRSKSCCSSESDYRYKSSCSSESDYCSKSCCSSESDYLSKSSCSSESDYHSKSSCSSESECTCESGSCSSSEECHDDTDIACEFPYPIIPECESGSSSSLEECCDVPEICYYPYYRPYYRPCCQTTNNVNVDVTVNKNQGCCPPYYRCGNDYLGGDCYGQCNCCGNSDLNVNVNVDVNTANPCCCYCNDNCGGPYNCYGCCGGPYNCYDCGCPSPYIDRVYPDEPETIYW